MTEYEWRPRKDFAEIAEVLGIDTTWVLAARPYKDGFLVIYSPDAPEDNALWSITLQRDEDGVLQRASERVPHPGMWEQIEESIKEASDDE